MLEITPSPTRRRLKRALQCFVITAMSACTGECDDPLGPDGQAVVGGSVTLNGEPVSGVSVSAGSARGTTGTTGQYSLNLQGDSDTFVACVTLDGVWGTIAALAAVLPCPEIAKGESAVVDWRFEQAAPTVRIQGPADGAEIPAGSDVALESTGSTSLRVNGAPSFALNETEWTSSRDGILGLATQSGTLTRTLSTGTHELTATISDLLGGSATDRITVQVVDPTNDPPVAEILSPPFGMAFPPGSTVDFSGTGTDPQEGALTGAALAWTSSQEGAIGTGQAFSRQMAEGSHIIVLTVTDAQGASDADTVAIHINSATGTGSIQGTVTIGGSPLDGIAVALSGTASANTTTNASGTYSFTDLASGDYTITITPPPGADIGTTQTITLGPGEAATVNFAG